MIREKTWTKDHVTITYRTYNTQLNLTVSETLTKAFRFPTPTEDDPNAHSIPMLARMFYFAMPSIVKVECEEGAPLWGIVLKEEVEKPTFLEDPIADYKRIQRTAPAEMLSEAEDGYFATREVAHLAPEDIRNDPPENPELDLEAMAARNGEKDLANPTTAGMRGSKRKSSPVLGLSSSQPQKGM